MKRITVTVSDENWSEFLKFKAIFITENKRDISFTEFINTAMELARTFLDLEKRKHESTQTS